MNDFNVGLIGYGMGGRIFHAPLINYVDGLNLVKIRETRAPNIAHAQERYPGVEIVSSTEAILSDPAIDLVVVAIPNEHHFAVAKAALLAGKHVVVEKPFTVTAEQADGLMILATAQGKMISVYHNRRWDADFQTVRTVMNRPELGRIVEFEAHYDRFRNTLRASTWKEEGAPGHGLLYDLGSHLIDQALTLFGAPDAITAFMARQRDNSDIVDAFEVLLHYDNLRVTLKSGMLVHARLPKYILLGTHGSFVKYGLDVQEADLDGGRPLEDADWGREPEAMYGVLSYRSEDGEDHMETIESAAGNYPAFYENIRAALAGEAPLAVTAMQARDVIRVIDLALQSHEERKTLPFS